MAEDDIDFRVLIKKENGFDVSKENQAPPPAVAGGEGLVRGVVNNGCQLEESTASYYGGSAAESAVVAAGGGRWDKSLGVLCQKFIMLFLITPVSHPGWCALIRVD